MRMEYNTATTTTSVRENVRGTHRHSFVSYDDGIAIPVPLITAVTTTTPTEVRVKSERMNWWGLGESLVRGDESLDEQQSRVVRPASMTKWE